MIIAARRARPRRRRRRRRGVDDGRARRDRGRDRHRPARVRVLRRHLGRLDRRPRTSPPASPPRRPRRSTADDGDRDSAGARPVDGLAAAALAAARRAGAWAWPPAPRSPRWRSGWPPRAARWRAALLLPASPAGPSRPGRSAPQHRAARAALRRPPARHRGRPPQRPPRRVRQPRARPRPRRRRGRASCTVPWLFAPVTIGGREYVDGGVWSPTNLDAAPAGRDTHVLCLEPDREHPRRRQRCSRVMRSVSRTAVVGRGAGPAPPRRRGPDARPESPTCAAIMGDQLHGPRAPRAGRWRPGYRQGLAVRSRRLHGLTARSRRSRRCLGLGLTRAGGRVGQRAHVGAARPPRGCRSRRPGPSR